ncbi:MAG: DUF1501 domain-containing protein [Gemmataceae bacterium]|nr:DUF1501 domain-containing protein [Gemmataceae bacterium]MCI0741264.1 DUF1501 domain-containing protein [Gemmataceae bacterium]
MFTIWGSKQGFCDGVTRRNFLQIGAFGASLTLADMLRLRASANAPGGSGTRSKSAIMVYLGGGPSHMDMWDLKPDAPAEFRGEFRPIATNVTGVQICEHFPQQARMWDKLACIRSIVSVDEHSDSLVMTGKSQRENMTANHPSFGSVVSRVRGYHNNIPPFVSLRGMSRGTEPGFLGIQHRPFSPSGPGVQNLQPLANVSTERQGDRRTMLEGFDNVRRDLDNNIAGLDSFTARAFDMISTGAVRTALDLGREPQANRQKYQGIDNFLTARRLIEAGVGCVTLSYGGWDTHGQNFQTLRRQLPILDRGIANLVQDLHERGLQNDVVLVVWGEFGRTPRVNNNAGRDHWAPVMGALVAGGGMRMGQAIGASSSRGERPQDRRYTVPQVLATLYRTLGIDPAQTFLNGTGRPIHIVDEREPVRELI